MDIQIRRKAMWPQTVGFESGFFDHIKRLEAARLAGVEVVHDEFLFESAEQHHAWLNECARLGVATE